jgi:hypothetical protein
MKKLKLDVESRRADLWESAERDAGRSSRHRKRKNRRLDLSVPREE